LLSLTSRVIFANIKIPLCDMIKQISFLITLVVAGLLVSCSSEPNNLPEHEKLIKALGENPDATSINQVINAFNKYITDNRDETNLISPVLEEAYQFSQKYAPAASSAYLIGLIRNSDKNSQKLSEWLYALAENLKSQNKIEASNVLYSNLIKNYADHPQKQVIEASLKGKIADNIIEELSSARTVNPNQSGLNTSASFKFVDACEAYALSDPSNPNTPKLLFDAAEIANLLKTYPKALSLFDWLIEEYPEYEKTPSALFIKAFTLENELKNEEQARLAYELFLEKYPDNGFADDARFSLENLGKSPEEVLKMIEERNKANQ
jgi:TolA-binding protein